MEKMESPKVEEEARVSEGNMELYRLSRTVDMAKKMADINTYRYPMGCREKEVGGSEVSDGLKVAEGWGALMR